ncbi:DNA polymerase II [Endothiovibrio diazotrophicus]
MDGFRRSRPVILCAVSTFTAFLLTRHWRDTPQGVELCYWAHSPQGPLRLLYPGEEAVCFIPADAPPVSESGCERRSLALATLDGAPVDGLYFRAQRGLQRLRERLPAGALCESDVRPHDRFLMERFIAAPMTVNGEAVARDGYLELLRPRLRPAEFTPELRYASLDIETRGRAEEVISIALSAPDRAEILTRGEAADWPGELPIRWCADERALLAAFVERLVARDPDLILGWNVVNFDLDLLERRCRHYGIPFSIGRGGEIATILQPRESGQPRVASIPGRVVLDGIDTLKAAFWSFDSFALGAVARELLGRDKLITDSGRDKVAEIERLYREDRPALAAYNLEDCRLVEAIFDHARLIDFALRRAAMTGLALGRQGGSVAAFDHLYLPRLHRAGRVGFDVGARRFDTASPGGYVMDSRPGFYRNVLVLDFKSLYPSIIRTFRIDPLGLADPGEAPIPGFLGATFSRERSILPELIAELWAKREEAKRNDDPPLSQAVKILMNSFYGVLGSPGCRFYDPRLASSITRRGHWILQRSQAWIEAQGPTVIYGDTDSLFVLLGEGIEEGGARVRGAELAAGLNRYWVDVVAAEFDLPSHLEIEFETHFLRFLMPTIRGAETGSKKRYAGTVRNRAGELEVRFKGLESVRSDWTPLARRFQRELYRRVFFDEPWRDYVRDVVARLKRGELDDELVYRKRLRQPLESYQRNVPPHAQAAKKLKRPGRVIRYLITVNGPEPLEARESAIDYDHYLERQLAPVADGLLHFLDESFERVAGEQLELFG